MITTPTGIPPRLREMLPSTISGSPAFVAVRPRQDSEIDNCTEEVRKQVEEHGGDSIAGWIVWEWVGAFLYSEFHMVWKSASSEDTMIDVTAKADGERQILFVPDSSIHYNNSRISGAHLALVEDPLVHRYIKAREVYQQIFDQTYGADFLGDVTNPTPQVLAAHFEREMLLQLVAQKYA
jgi:hypothetical protein